jgi:sec-independent protein translocase protein TatA
MNFGNMGFMEILVILVLVLLLFGAKRLPEIGASMGKGIREFKKNISDAERTLREPEPEVRSERLPRGAVDQAREDETRPDPKRLIN